MTASAATTDLPRAFHLPRGVPEPPLEVRQFHKLTALVPKLNAEFVRMVCGVLKDNARRLAKSTMSRWHILGSISTAAKRFAEHEVAPGRHGGYSKLIAASSGMVRTDFEYGIDGVAEALGLESAAARVPGDYRELVNRTPPRPLDWLGHKARGPEMILHVLAGAIPYPTMVTMFAGLMAGSGNLVKTSTSDPMCAVAFAGFIAEQEPELGDLLAVLPWAGGREDIEEIALSAAGVVTAYGSDDTIRDLRARTPAQTRFLAHPHRFSVGLVCKDADIDATGARVRCDVARYDLGGCLSPQAIFVEGDTSPFADKLAAGLSEWFDPFHPDRTPADIGAIQRSREKAEFAEYSGRPVRLLASEGNLDWTIVVQERPLRPFQLFNRVCNVVGVESYREIADLLGPSVKQLSCVGVSVPPDRRDEVVEFLVGLGAQRICRLGEMQTPPLSWHHDGRFHLADFLTWTDVEI